MEIQVRIRASKIKRHPLDAFARPAAERKGLIVSCEFYRRETPIARKPHICALCHGEIKPGEKYEHIVCLCSGYDIYDGKLHESCEDIQQRFMDANRDEEFQEDWVLEDIADRVCSDCPDKDDCNFDYQSVPRCKRVIEKYLMAEPQKGA